MKTGLHITQIALRITKICLASVKNVLLVIKRRLQKKNCLRGRY